MAAGQGSRRLHPSRADAPRQQAHHRATGHINQVINLRRELLEIGKNKMAKKGGRARANPPPALTRVEQEDPDSSDEELYRLMEQGSRGQ